MTQSTTSIKGRAMSASFASLKISEELYKEAQKSAALMHRSVPAQVEYWANLGRAVERRGATVQEIQTTLTELRGSLPSADGVLDVIRSGLANGDLAKGVRSAIRKEAVGGKSRS